MASWLEPPQLYVTTVTIKQALIIKCSSEEFSSRSSRTISQVYTLFSIRIGGCPLGTMVMNSLNFAVKRILFKIFRTNSNDGTELSTAL